MVTLKPQALYLVLVYGVAVPYEGQVVAHDRRAEITLKLIRMFFLVPSSEETSF